MTERDYSVLSGGSAIADLDEKWILLFHAVVRNSGPYTLALSSYSPQKTNYH